MKQAQKKNQRGSRSHRRVTAQWWLPTGLVLAAALFWQFRKPTPSSVPSSLPHAGEPRTILDTPTTNPPQTESEQELALHRETIQAVETLLHDLPGNDDAVYLAGLVHNDLGDAETAVGYWKRSLELDPSRLDAWDSLGEALLNSDQYEEAENHFRKAVELDPSLAESQLHLAEALSKQGRLDEVLALLSDVTTPHANIHQLLGQTHQELGHFDQATSAYRRALELQPDFMNVHYALSQILTRMGHSEQASNHWKEFSTLKSLANQRETARRDNDSPLTAAVGTASQAYTDIGRVYSSQQLPQKAEAAWQRARALDPHNPFCRVQLAMLLQDSGRREEALTAFEEAQAIQSDDPLIHLNLGHLCVAMGRLQQAISAYREVIRLKPERPEGHSALAQLLLTTRINLPEAVPLAQQVVRLLPTAPGYVLLARAFAANNNPGAAIASIDQAIQLDPTNHHFFQLREGYQRNQP